MESTAHWKLEGSRAKLSGSSLCAEITVADPSRGVDHWIVDGQPLSSSALGLKLPEPRQTASASSVEANVRGDDLIATYLSADAHAWRIQVYWRLRADLIGLANSDKTSPLAPDDARLPLLAAIELIVSVQTQRWSDRPRMSTQSFLNAATADRLMLGARNDSPALQPLPLPRAGQAANALARGTGCFCFALRESDTRKDSPQKVNYIELVHPADHHGTTLIPPATGALASDEAAHSSTGNLLVTQNLFADDLEKGVILRARALGIWLRGPLLAAPLGRLYDAFAQEKPPLTA